MIHTKEIENLDNFKIAPISSAQTCQIPLFHGTRRLALSATPEDLAAFYSACRTVMEFAQKFAKSANLDTEKYNEYRRSHNPLFLSTTVYLYNTSKYKYSELYITSSYSNALIFSHYAGGELGEYAYAQYKGFCDLNIALDEKTQQAGAIVQKEYEKYCNSEKVILVYNNVRFSDLVREGGTPFLVTESNDEDKEYNQFVINRLHTGIDSDTTQYNNNFSLLNLTDYTPWVLSEKDFRAGFSAFTRVKNVDTEIANHNTPNSIKWNF